METDTEFAEALTRLSLMTLGPANWRNCRRAIGSRTFGPSVGFTHLGLVHRLLTPEGKEEWLAVAVAAQAPSPPGVERAIEEALRRMHALSETAVITEQRQQTWAVLDQEINFRLVMLSDGQWSAVAETGSQFVSVNGRDWPVDGFRLVEVDPQMYLDTFGAVDG